MKLSTKVFLLALLNVGLLVLLLAVFVLTQFAGDINPLLVAPQRDKILSITRLLERDLEDAHQQWAPVFERYERDYGVRIAMVDNEGRIRGGSLRELPERVLRRVREGPERGMRRPPAPPPPGEEPPPRDQRPGAGRIFAEHAPGPLSFWVGVRLPVPDSGLPPVPGTLLLAVPSYFTSSFFFDARPWLVGLVAVLGVSALCWIPFLRGLNGAIVRLSKATERLAQGHFEAQIPQDRHDEVGQLGASINELSAQLTRFVTGQKRFLADVAHELCSPIARVQFAVGILERRVTEADREYVADLQAEIQHMSSLVNELLSFTKMGLQAEEVRLVPVNVAQIAQRAREREGPGDARIAIEVPAGHWVMADAPLLLRAIANLLRNGLRYAGEAGPVIVTSEMRGERVAILVRDSGPGVPAEMIGQVFEPFRRVDSARTRTAGGVGLGLAIVKSCVEACGGQIACRNRQPTGLEVEILLPASPAAN